MWRRIWGVLRSFRWPAIVVGALLGYLGIALDIREITTFALAPWAWITIGMSMFILSAFTIIFGYQRDNRRLSRRLSGMLSTKPNLGLHDVPYVDTRTIFSTVEVEGKHDVIGKPFFAHAQFRNNPKIRSAETTARNVIAELSFFDDNKNEVLGPIYGRWGDTPQPGTLSPFESIRDILKADFEPSGLPRELDIALKYPEDENIYAFNNDSCRHTSDWRLSRFQLVGANVYVKVRLVGEMIESEWWYMLHNDGKGQGMRVEVIS